MAVPLKQCRFRLWYGMYTHYNLGEIGHWSGMEGGGTPLLFIRISSIPTHLLSLSFPRSLCGDQYRRLGFSQDRLFRRNTFKSVPVYVQKEYTVALKISSCTQG